MQCDDLIFRLNNYFYSSRNKCPIRRLKSVLLSFFARDLIKFSYLIKEKRIKQAENRTPCVYNQLNFNHINARIFTSNNCGRVVKVRITSRLTACMNNIFIAHTRRKSVT
jgi:hypothetical protein